MSRIAVLGNMREAWDFLLARQHTLGYWRQTAGGGSVSFVARPVTGQVKEIVYARVGKVGVAPMAPGSTTTQTACLDIDDHDGAAGWLTVLAAAERLRDAAQAVGLLGNLARSSGGKGVHLLLLWDAPQDAAAVRARLRQVLTTCGLSPGATGLRHGTVEIFPKQDAVPADGHGSMTWGLPCGLGALLDDDGNPLPHGATHPLRVSDDVPALAGPPVLTLVRPRPADTGTPLATLAELLAGIPQEDAARAPGRDEWRDLIHALHHETGGSEDGRALAVAFSSRWPREVNAEGAVAALWDRASSDRGAVVGLGTLERVASRYRDPVAGLPMSAAEDEPPAEPERPTRKLFAISTEADLLAETPPRYIVQDYVPARGVGMIYGASGTMKTFFAMHLAACIADGSGFGPRKTSPRRAAYVFAEGAASAGNRVRAWRLHYGRGFAPGVIRDAPRLTDKDNVNYLASALRDAGVQFVVIDTLSRSSAGAEENSNSEMAALVSNCASLARAIDGCVTLVHHPGKDETRGARGAGALTANIDFEIEVSAHGDGQFVAVATKMRDCAKPAGLVYRGVVVDLGLVDEWLSPITSLAVVIEGEDAAAEPVRGSSRPRGGVGRPAAAVAAILSAAESLCTDASGAAAADVRAAARAERPTLRANNAHRALREAAAQGLIVLIGDRVYTPDALPAGGALC